MSRFVVVGATGYSGRLVCSELAGTDFVIAARDEQARRQLATLLGVDDVPGDMSRPDDVLRIASLGTVLNCVGPFQLWSHPLVACCAEAGTDYLDITGELPFVLWSRQVHHGRAERSGARVLHSCSFESLPADLLASSLQDPDDPLVSVYSYYAFDGAVLSPGTRLTARLASPDPHDVVDGRLVLAETRQRTLDGEPGIGLVVSYPEVAFFLWGLGVRRAAAHHLVTAAEANLALATRNGDPRDTDAILAKHSRSRRPGPDSLARRQHSFRLIVDGTHVSGRRQRVSLDGVDPYGMTAKLLLMAARQLKQCDVAGGVLVPSMTFNVAACLREIESWGIKLSKVS